MMLVIVTLGLGVRDSHVSHDRVVVTPCLHSGVPCEDPPSGSEFRLDEADWGSAAKAGIVAGVSTVVATAACFALLAHHRLRAPGLAE
ncbi:hypothetical protein ACFVUW_11390 [Streptomyces xiamenensis]|uniref:hypothetical protein n=1 Tax=Streptomyces xiamenensis TaxID=408015 RepID=UPI0036E911B3